MYGIYLIKNDGDFIATNLNNPKDKFVLTEIVRKEELKYIKPLNDQTDVLKFVKAELRSTDNRHQNIIEAIHNKGYGVGITVNEGRIIKTKQDNNDPIKVVNVIFYGIKNGYREPKIPKQQPKNRRKYTRRP